MTDTPTRLLRLPQVIELTGLSREAIRKRELRKEFPRRVKLGPRASAWRSDEVQKWVDSRPVAPLPAGREQWTR